MKTIHDVARLARTSTATVSHVINGTRFVSDELTKKVKDAMAELDYQPNMMARGLKGGSLKTIGVIVPDCTNNFFSEISRAIDRFCFAKGYNIILCNTDNDVNQQASYTDMLISKHIDGVIFISSNNTDEDVNKLRKFNIPVVIADRLVPYLNVDTIIVNNEKGGYEATKYLLSLGFTKIACISGPKDISSSKLRLNGYKKALEEAGLSVNENYIHYGDFHFTGGFQACKKFMKLKDRPQAIFASNDMMALGFINAVKDEGLNVPSDFSVVGFDNSLLASMTIPRITTIAQPLEELAQTATELILKKIEKHSDSVTQILLNPTLIERETCRKIN